MNPAIDFYEHYFELSKTSKRIADSIIASPLAFSYMSLHEASQKIDVSEVSLIKFARLYGFEKYTELRNAVREYLLTESGENADKTRRINGGERKPDCLQQFRQDISRNINVTLSRVDSSIIERCTDEILEAQDIYLFGHDVSKSCADYFSRKLKILRFNSHTVLLGDVYETRSVLAKLAPTDFVVVFSFRTYYSPTRSVVEMCQKKNIKIIGITDSSTSPAYIGAENTIFCQTIAKNTDICDFNTMSAPIAVIELILLRLAEKMGGRISEIMKEINGIGKSIHQ